MAWKGSLPCTVTLQAKATQLQHKLAEIMCRLDRALPAAVLEEVSL